MSTREEVIKAIRKFPFWDYGMDEVDPTGKSAEWVPALADKICAAIDALDVPRGQCGVCGNEFNLTKQGALRHHRGNEYDGLWRQVCGGVGKPPVTGGGS